ncbi:MAG: hypothetical protein EAX95_10030 [Candidatus Thorarchaeota archaeon]|nr:hypothetical protein [Candidatus Thorarchaeota archaeon]
MVIEGLRYGSNPLLEMRIHDLALLTDLSRHDPNHPDDPPPGGEPENDMKYDGTGHGLVEDPLANEEVNSFWSDLQTLCEDIINWWESVWPRLHLMLSWVTLAGGLGVLHLSVDLLGDLRYEDVTLETPLDDEMTETQENDWVGLVAGELATSGPMQDFFIYLGWGMVISLAALSIFVTFAPFPDPWKWTMMLYHFAIFGYWLGAMLLAVTFGWISTEYFVGLMGSILDSAIIDGIAVLIFGGAILALALKMKDIARLANIVKEAIPRMKWGIIGVAYYFTVVVTMLITWSVYLELSLAGYLGVEI